MLLLMGQKAPIGVSLKSHVSVTQPPRSLAPSLPTTTTHNFHFTATPYFPISTLSPWLWGNGRVGEATLNFLPLTACSFNAGRALATSKSQTNSDDQHEVGASYGTSVPFWNFCLHFWRCYVIVVVRFKGRGLEVGMAGCGIVVLWGYAYTGFRTASQYLCHFHSYRLQ
jgi:hypothetical protein